MPKITYIANGTDEGQTFEVSSGTSVMEGARQNGVKGIHGDCGGACACSTCHVMLNEEWFKKIGPADEIEEEMLAFAHSPTPLSRLSCQIVVTDDLDGLCVFMPEKQI